MVIRRSRENLIGNTGQFLEFSHQIDLGMQTAGRIDQHDIRLARSCRLQSVKHHRGRVGSFLLLDQIHTGPFGPAFELIDGGSPESVRRDHDDLFSPGLFT